MIRNQSMAAIPVCLSVLNHNSQSVITLHRIPEVNSLHSAMLSSPLSVTFNLCFFFFFILARCSVVSLEWGRTQRQQIFEPVICKSAHKFVVSLFVCVFVCLFCLQSRLSRVHRYHGKPRKLFYDCRKPKPIVGEIDVITDDDDDQDLAGRALLERLTSSLRTMMIKI